VIDAMFAAGMLEHTRPSAQRAVKTSVIWILLWVAPLALLVAWHGANSVFVKQGLFFSQAAVVTFGGGYSVLSYVAQRVIEDFAWLRPGEMVDGLALAETTPGPLILVLQFVGYVSAYRLHEGLAPWAAGLLGAGVTLWVTFVPCFLWIFLGAPYIESLRHIKALNAALASITAAVVGVILNLSVWFALHTLFGEVRRLHWGLLHITVPNLASTNPAALVLALLALIATLRFKLAMHWTLLGCALAGLALKAVGA
jgi:chromate transporter